MAQHELEISPKGKQKKSLCQILLAKKGVNNRVGCMAVDSVENDESLGDNEMQSARIGLCCAVTDTHGSPTVSLPRNSNTTASTRPLDVSSINKTVSELKTNGFSNSITNRPVSSPIENTQKERSRLRRRVLTQRRSADNLYPSIPPSSPLRFSSPESSHSAPVDTKVRGSVSHDTVVCNTGSPSMDSLARQALLAAQVLHLIPTTKARQRNYLQGRIGANSLLGPIELERVVPNREVKIFIGSWNMNEEAPPRELNDFILPSVLDYVPDVLAIGTQESCSEKFEWEVSLQETLGPSHVLLHSATLGTLHLAIFIRRDLIWYCSVCEEDSLSVRPGTAFKTKGAVAIAFMLFGTSYLFVTAHLTAHQEKVKERVSDIKRIIRSLDLPKNLPVRYKTKGKKDVTQNFDCVFWCGDLNFRLTEPRDQVLDWIRKTNFPLPAHLPHGMLHVDQLQAILADGAAFKGFQEAKITFPPTYKYDPGSQKFDTSAKQRTPAYTDRILFKYRTTPGILNGFTRRPSTQTGTGIEQRPSLECIIYDSVPGIVTSDHKPVWGVFKSILRPGDDTTPLAAGMFNREVYLEGIKRRVANLGRVSGASTVCSIQ